VRVFPTDPWVHGCDTRVKVDREYGQGDDAKELGNGERNEADVSALVEILVRA